MTCAVSVIETFLPEKLSGESVEGKATGAFRKDCPVQRNVSLEYQRIRFALHLSRLGEVHGTGGVGGPVEVLPARVTEVHRPGVNDGAVADLWLVVDHRSIRTRGGNGIEGQPDEVLVLAVTWVRKPSRE